MTALTWSPTIDFVRETIADQGKLRLIVAPFIKLDALRELVDECADITDLQVVVRWQAGDLVAGASDVEIYPFLKEKHIPLFRHTSIHLKLLVYDKSLAFHSSGNVTKKGLGLIPDANIEIGCPITLDPGDWRQLIGLLSTSEEVDDQMYEQARQYALENKSPSARLPKMNLTPAISKEFSKDSLPACESPDLLFAFYSGATLSSNAPDEAPEFIHDLMLYSITDGLSEKEFYELLSTNFKSNSFTKALVQFIRERGSVHFGGVTTWIADRCTDSPRPYRRDLKTTTRHLYNWLSYFFDEITWDQPNVSMVVYWKETDD